MTIITKSSIDKFVELNTTSVSMSEDNIASAVAIVEKPEIPFTFDQLTAIEKDACDERVRRAATKKKVSRLDGVVKAMDKASDKGMDLEEFAQWLGLPPHSSAHDIMDRAVEWVSLDKNLRKEPSTVKLDK